jgi:transcriptional regulator GlxA family with amidase domain
MKVAILNYNGVVPTSVTGPYDMIDKIGMIAHTLNVPAKASFKADIVDSASVGTGTERHCVVGNVKLSEAGQYDLVLIPAMNFPVIGEALSNETEMLDWVKQQYKGGADIAAICLGTFLLAQTGLLEGKRATTHWMGVPTFRKMFPGVILEDDKVIIDEGRIYTCGAAYSFTSLLIYLIEKFGGRDLALAAAKVFMIQVHDAGQHVFSIFDLQHRHEEKEISNVQRYVEKNFAKRISIGELAEKANMSQRSFIRKFTEATGNTPLEYIQRVKVEAAKRMLEKGTTAVEETSRKVGYEDFNSFRNVFRKFTGVTPQEYKRRYGNMFKEIVG